MKLDPPRPGGVHLNKALPYKVSPHKKNIDQPFKKKQTYGIIWYVFVSKLQLVVAF